MDAGHDMIRIQDLTLSQLEQDMDDKRTAAIEHGRFTKSVLAWYYDPADPVCQNPLYNL